MAVLAPMPSARAKTAISVKAGFFSRVRMANRLFWPMPANTMRVRRSSRKMADGGRTLYSLPHAGNALAQQGRVRRGNQVYGQEEQQIGRASCRERG